MSSHDTKSNSECTITLRFNGRDALTLLALCLNLSMGNFMQEKLFDILIPHQDKDGAEEVQSFSEPEAGASLCPYNQ